MEQADVAPCGPTRLGPDLEQGDVVVVGPGRQEHHRGPAEVHPGDLDEPERIPVEAERLLDVADLEHDVPDPFDLDPRRPHDRPPSTRLRRQYRRARSSGDGSSPQGRHRRGHRRGRLHRRLGRAGPARSRLPRPRLRARRRRRLARSGSCKAMNPYASGRLTLHAADLDEPGCFDEIFARLRRRRPRVARQHVRRPRVRPPDVRPHHRQRRVVGNGAPRRRDVERGGGHLGGRHQRARPAPGRRRGPRSPTSRTRSARPSAGRATRWARSSPSGRSPTPPQRSGRWDAITVCPADNVGPILSRAPARTAGRGSTSSSGCCEGRCEIFQGTGPYRPWMTVDVRDDAACHIGLLESESVANGERYIAWSTETRNYEDICTIDRPGAARAAPRPRSDRRRHARALKEREAGVPLDLGRLHPAQRPHPRRRADHVPAARRLDPRLRRVAARRSPTRRSTRASEEVGGRQACPQTCLSRPPGQTPPRQAQWPAGDRAPARLGSGRRRVRDPSARAPGHASRRSAPDRWP